jgi:Na+/H+-dicarboxylate symporter
LNLSAWVLVGAASGMLCGVFFGEYAAVVEPIGAVYVALLEMVVFPFRHCAQNAAFGLAIFRSRHGRDSGRDMAAGSGDS